MQVSKVSKLLGTAAANTARCWGLEVGILDDVGVCQLWWPSLPPNAMAMATNMDTDATLVAADALS